MSKTTPLDLYKVLVKTKTNSKTVYILLETDKLKSFILEESRNSLTDTR